jgi:hypothetical protein
MRRTSFDILDLRHFSAHQLRPLLEDEGVRWRRRLDWNYSGAIEMLLEYLDDRVLPGFAALDGGRVIGYTFGVFEATKAILGDVYALSETEQPDNPLCETLLHHLIEMLQAAPGIDRIEAQLLMFPSGALNGPFLSRGFRATPRLFMTALPIRSCGRSRCRALRRASISSHLARNASHPGGRSFTMLPQS